MISIKGELKRKIMEILLSKREREIVSFLEKGFTTKEIAEQLFLSNHTVDTHRRNILRKSEVKNTAQLIYRINNRKQVTQLAF